MHTIAHVRRFRNSKLWPVNFFRFLLGYSEQGSKISVNQRVAETSVGCDVGKSRGESVCSQLASSRMDDTHIVEYAFA